MVLPPAPLLAGTKKGDKLRNQARTEEVKGNLEHAYELTRQAVAEDPADPAYTLQMHRIRFELGNQDVAKARKLRMPASWLRRWLNSRRPTMWIRPPICRLRKSGAPRR